MPKADERLALSLVNQLSCPSNYIPALIPSFAPSFCMGMYRTTEAVRGRTCASAVPIPNARESEHGQRLWVSWRQNERY